MALVEPESALHTRTPGSGGSPRFKWGPWTALFAKTSASLLLLAGLAALGMLVSWTRPRLQGVQLDARPLTSLGWLAPSKPEDSERGVAPSAQAPLLPGPPTTTQPVRASALPNPLTPVEPLITPVSATEGTPSSAPQSSGLTPDGKVILNRASAEELRRLPGVGAKRAEAILALRTKLGRFKSPHDLLRLKGIGPKTLRRWLPLLVLDPSDAQSQPKT